MKLSKTLCYMLFIVTAVFSMPVLAVTPLGQIDSFDNIVGTGWTEPTGTGLMAQDNTTKHEGTGSIRVKFEDRDPEEWDVVLERVISLNLDYNVPVALTFWVDTNQIEPPSITYPWTDECVKELILFQGDNIARFAVPEKNTGWRKITAGTSAFTLDTGSFDWAAIDKIQFWCSTWDTPGGSVWIDDLRLELTPPKNSPCQLASFDDIAAEGWYDGRHHGWMLQTPPGDANFYEGTGSMKMAFSLYTTGNVDIEPTMNFVPPLDLNDYRNLAITLWVWSDRSNSKFREIILYDIDDPPHNGRFVAHPPDSNGWTKVVANLAAFSWYEEVTNYPVSPDDVNLSSIRTIGLFSSCGASNNRDIYLDDLRLDSNQVVLSDATIVNAERTFGTITVDGNAADWANLDDSDVVDFDLATVPDQPHGNLHVQYRLAWDPNYLYILVKEIPGDGLLTEANMVGGGLFWNMNDGTGGDAYYDALTLYFDFTNLHWILGGEEGISLWLYLGLASHGQTNLMMAWTNADWGHHKPAAVVNGQYAETGTGLGNRVVEAKVKWSDLDSAIDEWRLPEGGLAAAVKPGYIFGCNPRLNDFEKSTMWGSPTVEKGTAWLNGKLWDWQGTPSATGIYAKDVRLVCSAGDLDGDCDVDFVDYAQFAEEWLNDGCNNLNGFCNGADIVINGEVNMEDLAKFTQRWLD